MEGRFDVPAVKAGSLLTPAVARQSLIGVAIWPRHLRGASGSERTETQVSSTSQPKAHASGIKWFLAVSGVVLAAVALAYAILSGQQLRSISPTEIIFGQERVPTEQVEKAQPQVQASVDQLERQIDQAPVTSNDTANFSGYWSGGDGQIYQISQSGSQAVISINTPYGIAMYGNGNVQGNVFTFAYTTANYMSGYGSLKMEDTHRLSGSFTSGGRSAEAIMTR